MNETKINDLSDLPQCRQEYECRVLNAPPGCGLLISMDQSACRILFSEDANWKAIHPHVYAPASLEDVRALKGGGSGVPVFHGLHTELGDLVMKHGSYKDTAEVFALAKIMQELTGRGAETDEASVAAARMKGRIPEFRFVYISPHHLRDRSEQLWNAIRRAVFSRAFSDQTTDTFDRSKDKTTYHHTRRENHKKGRKIRLVLGKKDAPTVDVVDGYFEIGVGPYEVLQDDVGAQYVGPQSEIYIRMEKFIREFLSLQRERFWKLTLAQSMIGDGCSCTVASVLASGELNGSKLKDLIDEFVIVIHSLQALTWDEEKGGMEGIRKEVERYGTNSLTNAADVSPLVDSYVGFAIRKNFHPEMGRFKLLRDKGKAFRSSSLVLTEREKLPASLLGTLLEPGASMDEVFTAAPSPNTPLDDVCDSWRSLLRQATKLNKCAAVEERMWTGGLTDAGIHNMFFTDKIWLFDLGEPCLVPLPAFLTKFLMSFFHTLGMEEMDNGEWVVRFELGEKLSLTAETMSILPKAYDAFNTTTDRLISDLFEGEEEIRELLVTYVVLQLLSDAAFCLNKWEIKGGGAEKIGGYNRPLEKWLWRALWDIYVAADVKSNLSV